MNIFAWILWWIYTVFLGLTIIGVVTVAIIYRTKRFRKISINIDGTILLSIATYVFITMLVFGNYL
ncbi:MAG: hypothetical protein J6V44_16665 [Methanobrevibacter sp.]|nr:hypothetical protein [Methanobrevibacter sp.]MBO7691963.1 hypothetical protein [Methanobrevibacter sp.]